MTTSYREASNEAKAVRQGIVEARPIGGKKRQGKKDVVVELRYPGSSFKWAARWHKFGAYPDLATAQQVVDNKTRGKSGTTEYRIKP